MIVTFNGKFVNFGGKIISIGEEIQPTPPGPTPTPGNPKILNIFKYNYSENLSSNKYGIFYVYTPTENKEFNELVVYSCRDKTPTLDNNCYHCSTIDDVVEIDTELPEESTTFTSLMSYKNAKTYDNETKEYQSLSSVRCYGEPTTIEGLETTNKVYKYSTKLNEGTITLEKGKHYLIGITVTTFNSYESPDWDIVGIEEEGTFNYFSCELQNSSGGLARWTNPKVSTDNTTNVRPLFELNLV